LKDHPQIYHISVLCLISFQQADEMTTTYKHILAEISLPAG